MKKNLGITDRIIRFVAIDLLLGFSLFGLDLPALYANTAFILCIILAITIISGYDPLYHLFGISSKEDKVAEQ